MDKTLFNYCRYYKGEQSCPLDDERASLWDYERKWCEMQNAKDNGINDMLCEYNMSGLDAFEQYDGTPVSLKAFLFNRFCHWDSGAMQDCIEPFKKWYNETYKKAGR